MIEFELNCDFVLIEKIFLSGILSNKKSWKKIEKWKWKMKKKTQLLVELCYNYHFSMSDSSILDYRHCEKVFQKYSINQKILNKVNHWLTLKRLFYWCFLYLIRLSRVNQQLNLSDIFWCDDDLRLKNHSRENGNLALFFRKLIFFFFFFIFIFQFFSNFLFDNIPLKNIFSMSTKSQFNSNSIKSYRYFLSGDIFWKSV